MIGSLAWKEYRAARGIWLVMTLLGTACVFLLPRFMEALGETDADRNRTTVAISLLVLAVTYGVVAGSMLLAGEWEEGTLVFLDALTARRRSLWRGKLLMGVGLALTQGMALALPYVLTHQPSPEAMGLPLFLFLLPLEAFLWGLFSSSLSGSVLGGAGMGGFLYVLSWVLTLAVIGQQPAPVAVTRLLIDALALSGSYLVFCAPDRQRRGATGAVVSRSQRAIGWRSLVWLTWRQGRSEVAVLAPAAFVLGVAFAPIFLAWWPLWTLVTGVVFGTGIWRNEQTEKSYRFFSNQRFPPGRVWLAKTTFGLAAALLVIAAGCLGGAVQLSVLASRQQGSLFAWVRFSNLSSVVLYQNSFAVAALWLVHGFAAGQLFGLLSHKPLVAVMVSVPVGTALIAPWLPSLIGGDLPPWQVYVIPLLLLLASRLILWAWATDCLATRQPLLALGACGLVGCLWVAGCLTWRVYGAPDVGAPFDVPAFQATLPAIPDNEAAREIRLALQQLLERRRRLFRERPPPPGFGPRRAGSRREEPRGLEPLSEQDQARLFRDGWHNPPPRRGEDKLDWLATLGTRLDGLFDQRGEEKQNWLDTLERAVALPLGMLHDPTRPLAPPALNELTQCRILASLCRARALQLQAGGDASNALRLHQILLRLSLQLRNKAPALAYEAGLAIESHAFEGLTEWARSPAARPDQIRHVIDNLADHERNLPSTEDVLRADYLTAYPRLLDAAADLAAGNPHGRRGYSRLYGQLFILSLQMPWEQVRARRRINAHYEMLFRGEEPPVPDNNPLWSHALGPANWASFQVAVLRGLCQGRALRLQLALNLFERENHRPAANLNELVGPTYLAALPTDPYTGRGFHYRIAEKNAPLQRPFWAANRETQAVVKGQGVLWSTGPDGTDDGGETQGWPGRARPSQATSGSDWIFVVPLSPER
jgi:hypothetical protein